MALSKEGTDVEVLVKDYADRYQLDEETLRKRVRERLTALAAEKIATTAFEGSRATWGDLGASEGRG